MIQVYTGEGKGKTTAALGLALRAAGGGLKVFILQFCKGRECSELRALEKIKNITLKQFGMPYFIRKSPNAKDVVLARAGFEALKRALASRRYNMIILDEVNVAVELGLIKLGELISAIKKTPKKIELVLTGRSAHPEIIKLADLVSEIKELKHYYNKGIKARKGIEY